MTPVGCTVGPPITGQLTLEGIPVPSLADTGSFITCLGFSVWWRYRTQWGPLKPFEGTVHGAHEKPLQIAGENTALRFAMGRSSRSRMLHSNCWTGIAALFNWDGHHAAAARPD